MDGKICVFKKMFKIKSKNVEYSIKMETLLKDGTNEKNEKSETVKEEPTRQLVQYLAATAASLVLMISGTVLGWSSPVLPKLQGLNSTLPVTENEGTWVGSLVAIGAIVGPFPAGICADLLGRKRALLAVAIPFMMSWVILAVANSVYLLYIGRIISGFSNGWGMTLLPMYIGEIATPEARGALSVLGQILITSGFLYVYAIGPFVSYVWLNILCGFIPVLFFITFIFMPESPYYEMSKNNHEAAGKSLMKLRGKSQEGIKKELIGIQVAVEESQRSTGTWADLFSDTANRKAIFLMCSLMAIQQFSGINVVLFYSEDIFKKAGSSLSPSIATIVVGLVMFAASFPTPYLIEKLGRRIVQILSAAGMMIFLAILGVSFFLNHLGYDTSKISWLPLLSVIGYIILYSFGLGPVPWAMIGEMFSTSIRSKGAAFTAAFSWFLAFVMTKCFSLIVNSLGSYTGFWLCSASCGLGALFIYFLLPETKGKTLEQIQEELNQ